MHATYVLNQLKSSPVYSGTHVVRQALLSSDASCIAIKDPAYPSSQSPFLGLFDVWSMSHAPFSGEQCVDVELISTQMSTRSLHLLQRNMRSPRMTCVVILAQKRS